MFLVNAEHLRLFALHLAGPREQRHKQPRAADIEPCDLPLTQPRNDMEELLHALGCLVPPERG